MRGSPARPGSSGPAAAPGAGRRSVRVVERSSAPVAAVWPLVGEAGRWAEWSFLTRSGLIRPGAPVPDGVGAVRRFTRLGVGSSEEVLAWDPPGHLAYAIVKGFPVRNHRADVSLEPDGGGTRITWEATFDERFAGTGALMVHVMRSILSRFATAVARYAESGPGPGTGPDGHPTP